MRPLNPLEQIFSTVDGAASLNFTFCVHLEGDLNLDVVRGAMGAQLKRYPALGLCIAADEGAPQWTWAQNPPRLDVVSSGAWHSALAQSLNTPFIPGVEPALRVRWIRSESESRLLITFNHCLVDGRTGAMVVTDLLRDAGSLSRGEQPHITETYPLHIGPDFTGRWRGTGPLPHRVVHFGQGTEDRRTAVLPIELDAEQSSALIASTTRHGVSTTATICAAHLLGLASINGTGPLSLSLPIDWRGRLDGVDEHAFGLLVGNAHLVYRLRADDDPWALARRLSGDFRSAALSAQPIADPHTATDLDGLYQGRASTAVSNVGTLAIAHSGTHFRVVSACFGVGCSFFGDQIVTAARVGERFSLMYCVATGSVPIDTAREIASQTVTRLNGMLE
jgi:hypothetical protein